MSSKRPGHKPRKEEYLSDSDSDDKQHSGSHQGGYTPVTPVLPQSNISQPSYGGHQPTQPIVSVEHQQPIVCPTGGPVYPQTNPQVPGNYPTGNIGSQPTNPPQVPSVYPSGNIEYPPRSPNAPGLHPSDNIGYPPSSPQAPGLHPTDNIGYPPSSPQAPGLHPTDNIGYPPSNPQAPGLYPSDNIGYPPSSPQAPGLYPSDNMGYPPTNPQLPGSGYPPSGYPQGGVQQPVGFSVGNPNYGLEHNQYGAGQTGQHFSDQNSSYVPGMPPPTSHSGGINYGYNQGGHSNYEPGVPRY